MFGNWCYNIFITAIHCKFFRGIHMSSQVNPQILRDFPFFAQLSDEYLYDISLLCTMNKYNKGDTIFHEGDEGEELYLIASGVVQIYQDNLARDIILSILREGDFFGEMALLQSEKVRSASAMAIEKSSICVLKKSYFNTLVQNKPEILMHILETSLNRLRDANRLISDLTILDVRKRVARVLIRLNEQHGVKSPKGYLIDIKLTHQQLADMTGTARETITKILLELQQEQLIRIDQKKIMVTNLDKLKRIVDSF